MHASQIERMIQRFHMPGHRAFFGAPPVTGRPPGNFFNISIKSDGGRWETARESVGHQSITAGISPNVDLKSTGDRRDMDSAPPMHRWGSTTC